MSDLAQQIDDGAPYDIRNCARCGGDHDDVTPEQLEHHHDPEGPETYTHWSPCPNNGEPILWAVVDTDD